jgi:hypothetical protein
MTSDPPPPPAPRPDPGAGVAMGAGGGDPDVEAGTDSETGTPQERGRSLRRSARLTALVGSLFAILYVVSIVVISLGPGAYASDDAIRAYYASDAAGLPLVVGLYVMPLAGVCFIWFIVVLRIWAVASGRRPAILQSNLQLVSGIIFVVLTFVAAAAATVVSAASELDSGRLNIDAARQFPIFGRAIQLFFTTKMAAMFVITTSLILRSPRAFPNWFVYVGYAAAAVLALSPVFSPLLVLIFPAWILVLCAIVFRAARRIPGNLFVDDILEAGGPGGIRSSGPLVAPEAPRPPGR